jgi:heat shock protein HtpX
MFELIRANRRRSAVLVAVMAVLLVALGWSVGEVWIGSGGAGAFLALMIWGAMTLISYYSGDRIVLAISGSKKIDKQDHPVLYNVVEEMCVASGQAKLPELYIIDDPAPNAFATGRDPEHASVAVTSGLLNLLTRDELQGVIAHEIAHVRNRDVLYMMMVAIMMGTIVLLGDGARRMMFYGSRSRTSSRRGGGGGGQAIVLVVAVLLIILAPILAQFIYLAISRRREHLADASGAQYSRYPEGLASALEKIGASTHKLRTATQATAPMYFVNPLAVTARGLTDLTATHPPLSERIRILRSMGGVADLRAYDEAFRKVSGRPVGLIPFSAMQETGVRSGAQRAPFPAGAPVPVPTRARPLPLPIDLPGPPVPGMTALAPAVAAEAAEHAQRVRQTTDLLWKKQDYAVVDCPCETRLKIPPVHRRKKIECPHCARVHMVA